MFIIYSLNGKCELYGQGYIQGRGAKKWVQGL